MSSMRPRRQDPHPNPLPYTTRDRGLSAPPSLGGEDQGEGGVVAFGNGVGYESDCDWTRRAGGGRGDRLVDQPFEGAGRGAGGGASGGRGGPGRGGGSARGAGGRGGWVGEGAGGGRGGNQGGAAGTGGEGKGGEGERKQSPPP